MSSVNYIIKHSFPVVTGIHDALNRFPTEFLHPDDIYWSQVAFYLCKFKTIICVYLFHLQYCFFKFFSGVMGNWNEPCTYRLKRQNPDGYIHIECEIQPATHESVHGGVMNILSTVRETGGERLIKDTQKRLKDQLLELLVSYHNENRYFKQRFSLDLLRGPDFFYQASTPT